MQLVIGYVKPPIHNPIDTAGFKWHPEIRPIAYAIVTTVKPKARATPTNPIPNSRYAAASTTLTHPTKTKKGFQ